MSPLPVLLVALASGGCYSAQLDPALAGVFACGDPDDDEPCPDSLVCVNGRCEDADAAPTLTVLLPEDEQSVMRDDVIDVSVGMQPVPGTTELEVRFQGNLELIARGAGADHELGKGHVKVFVDGTEQATVDTGDIDSSTAVLVRVPLASGPHRIHLQAYRNDDVPYDNPEALATRLFWFENSFSRRPFVAIKSPWPGTVLDVDDADVEVVLAVTPPFELVDPPATKLENRGHAHVYYDPRMPYPECVRDRGCDNDYIDVIGAAQSKAVALPEDEEGTGQITAALRYSDHSPYGLPVPCDPAMPGPLDLCAPVFDRIDIVRVSD